MVSAHRDLWGHAGLGAQRETSQCLGESQTVSKDGVKSTLFRGKERLRKLSSVLQIQSSVSPGLGFLSPPQPSLLLLRAAARPGGRLERWLGDKGRAGAWSRVGTLVWLSANHPHLSLLGDSGCLGLGVLGQREALDVPRAHIGGGSTSPCPREGAKARVHQALLGVGQGDFSFF